MIDKFSFLFTIGALIYALICLLIFGNTFEAIKVVFLTSLIFAVIILITCLIIAETNIGYNYGLQEVVGGVEE